MKSSGNTLEFLLPKDQALKSHRKPPSKTPEYCHRRAHSKLSSPLQLVHCCCSDADQKKKKERRAEGEDDKRLEAWLDGDDRFAQMKDKKKNNEYKEENGKGELL